MCLIKKPVTYILDGEVQHLSHEGRQLRHQSLVAVVLSHVCQHDGPKRRGQKDLAPRYWRRLHRNTNVNLKTMYTIGKFNNSYRFFFNLLQENEIRFI